MLRGRFLLHSTELENWFLVSTVSLMGINASWSTHSPLSFVPPLPKIRWVGKYHLIACPMQLTKRNAMGLLRLRWRQFQNLWKSYILGNMPFCFLMQKSEHHQEIRLHRELQYRLTRTRQILQNRWRKAKYELPNNKCSFGSLHKCKIGSQANFERIIHLNSQKPNSKTTVNEIFATCEVGRQSG